jgi:hypothetical protein
VSLICRAKLRYLFSAGVCGTVLLINVVGAI